MPRKIIFRGRVIVNFVDEIIRAGDFFYGDLLQCANGETFIRQQETGAEMRVDPETVGQYVGGNDKHGRDIYEGDIILFSDSNQYCKDAQIVKKVIGYNERDFAFEMCNIEDDGGAVDISDWKTISIDWWRCFNKNMSVIGNIYDNPELLNCIKNKSLGRKN